MVLNLKNLYYFSIIGLVLILTACISLQSATPEFPVTLVVYDSLKESSPTSRPIQTLILPTKTAEITPSTLTTTSLSSGSQDSTPLDPTATLIPSTLTPTRLPSDTSDLLFLSGRQLMRWDHVTNYTTNLVENVVDYSVSAAGEYIALLRLQKLSANGVQLYHLDILDFKTKMIHTLIENTPRIYRIAIAPDGMWIAYLPQDGAGQILVVSASESSSPIKLGDCRPSNNDHCLQMHWSPDSRYIAWSDREGIWFSSIRRNSPYLVLPNQVEIMDPENRKQIFSVSFGNLKWSPVGRFILVQIIPSPEGVRWLGIVDTLDGRLVHVPDTSEFSKPSIGALWTSNGDLLITHGGNSKAHLLPFARIWKVIPTRNDLLVLNKNIDLQVKALPVASILSSFENDYGLTALYQDDPLTFFLQITPAGAQVAPSLYSLNLKDGSLQQLLELPQNVVEVLWSPDGNGALVITEARQIYFAYTQGEGLLSLADAFGAEVHQFYWLPPAPRS